MQPVRSSGATAISAVLAALIVGHVTWYALDAVGLYRAVHLMWPDVWAPDWLVRWARHAPGWWPLAKGIRISRATMGLAQITLASVVTFGGVAAFLRAWRGDRPPGRQRDRDAIAPISQAQARQLSRTSSYRVRSMGTGGRPGKGR